MFNYIVLDVETGGLDAERSALLSLAARDSAGREFYSRVKAFEGAQLDERALQINGLNPSEGEVETNVALAFAEWIAGAPAGWLFVGANPAFDHAFLSAFNARNGNTFRLDYHKVDVQSMAVLADARGEIALPIKNGQPQMSLNAVLAALGMARVSNTHDALEDVRLTEAAMLRLIRKS